MRTKRSVLTLPASVLMLAALLIAGCDDFSLVDQFYRDTGLPLEIRPTTVAVRSDGTVDFVALGGAPEYTFALAPGGVGTIDPESGVYRAPDAEVTTTVQVTDKKGSLTEALVFVFVPPALSISPSGTSVAYGASRQFVASGGTGEYSFSVTDVGLGTVDSSGMFTAAASGTDGATVGVEVTDGVSTLTATVTLSSVTVLTIEAANTTIPQGGMTMLTALEGTPDYSQFSRTNELWVGGLPPSPGSTSGPPSGGNIGYYTAGASIGTVDIQVSDAAMDTDVVTIEVVPATPQGFSALSSFSTPSGDGPKDLKLEWSYDAAYAARIHRFTIWRSTVKAGPYAEIAAVDPAARYFVDSGSPNTMYYYRIYAENDGPPTRSSAFAEANSTTN